MQRIYNVNLNENYCSKYFRKSIIIILRKSQKKFYSFVFLYKLIVLFNIINKFIKYIIIKRINFLTKKHNLLFRIYFEIKKKNIYEIRIALYNRTYTRCIKQKINNYDCIFKCNKCIRQYNTREIVIQFENETFKRENNTINKFFFELQNNDFENR